MQTVIFYSALVLSMACLFLLLFGLAEPRIVSKALGRNFSRVWLAAVLGILFIVFAGLTIVTEPKSPPADIQRQQQETRAGHYKVVEIVDGDTIKVEIDGVIETVRLIGIDAPEVKECFAKESTAKAQGILRGQQVKLEADDSQDNRDTYGRLLRYVFLEDGTNFNRLMIAEGYAREFTFISPYTYREEFKQAQKEAKNKELGLWPANTCRTIQP